ncbi:MAG: hypothetical protein WBX11_16255 [Thiobacillaceae bacterium]|jgi:hypothetical protein
MNKTIASALIMAPALILLSLPVTADERGRGWGAHGGGWHGDIRHFDRHDLDHWRYDGRWRHGWHDGRIGWWWVVGGIWYFYPAPLYPYPDPYVPPVVVQQQAPVVVQQPPPVVVQDQPPVEMQQQSQGTAPPSAQAAPPQPTQNWYYCEPSKAYYPYVSTCPADWKLVPATPPGAPQ